MLSRPTMSGRWLYVNRWSMRWLGLWYAEHHGAVQNMSSSSRNRDSRATASDCAVFFRSNGRLSMRRSEEVSLLRFALPVLRMNWRLDSGMGNGTISDSGSHSMRKRW